MTHKPALAIGTALIVLAAKAFAEPAPQADKIAILVSTLSQNQLWMNGIAPRVRLGRDASPSQVLDRTFQMISRDAGALTDYQIIEVRRVVIPPGQQNSAPLIAVQVDSNLGPKIVLMRFEQTGWWTRVYDAR